MKVDLDQSRIGQTANWTNGELDQSRFDELVQFNEN